MNVWGDRVEAERLQSLTSGAAEDWAHRHGLLQSTANGPALSVQVCRDEHRSWKIWFALSLGTQAWAAAEHCKWTSPARAGCSCVGAGGSNHEVLQLTHIGPWDERKAVAPNEERAR
eukprot:1161278-Pelagomonas_calceolata.AAC.7